MALDHSIFSSSRTFMHVPVTSPQRPIAHSDPGSLVQPSPPLAMLRASTAARPAYRALHRTQPPTRVRPDDGIDRAFIDPLADNNGRYWPAVSRQLLTIVDPTRVRLDCAQTTWAVTPRCRVGRATSHPVRHDLTLTKR